MTHIPPARLKRIIEMPIAALPSELREMATELLQRRAADRWIPTSEAKPEAGRDVLCFVRKYRHIPELEKNGVGYIDASGQWWVEYGKEGAAFGTSVTHWRPIPDFKEEK